MIIKPVTEGGCCCSATRRARVSSYGEDGHGFHALAEGAATRIGVGGSCRKCRAAEDGSEMAACWTSLQGCTCTCVVGEVDICDKGQDCSNPQPTTPEAPIDEAATGRAVGCAVPSRLRSGERAGTCLLALEAAWARCRLEGHLARWWVARVHTTTATPGGRQDPACLCKAQTCRKKLY